MHNILEGVVGGGGVCLWPPTQFLSHQSWLRTSIETLWVVHNWQDNANKSHGFTCHFLGFPSVIADHVNESDCHLDPM